MNANGYQQYKNQSILTMTKGELLIVLYDELIKRLKRAEFSLRDSNFELFDESVQRAQDIVKHLKDTLNHEYEISRELSNLYDFFQYQLIRLKAGRNTKLIEELIPLINDLRDAFKIAEKNV